MKKPTICIGKNKGADQLRSYCGSDWAEGSLLRSSSGVSSVVALSKSHLHRQSYWMFLIQAAAWENQQSQGKNKGADQLRSNCEADQRLCFRYTDSTIPVLS